MAIHTVRSDISRPRPPAPADDGDDDGDDDDRSSLCGCGWCGARDAWRGDGVAQRCVARRCMPRRGVVWGGSLGIYIMIPTVASIIHPTNPSMDNNPV